MCRWMASAMTVHSGCSFRPTRTRWIGQTLMGRSVLGRSDDGGANYTYIGELSRSKFINVSVQPGHIDRAAPETGLAIGTPVLWIFGSGRYRMSDIYLAVMPLAGFPGPIAGILFHRKRMGVGRSRCRPAILCRRCGRTFRALEPPSPSLAGAV